MDPRASSSPTRPGPGTAIEDTYQGRLALFGKTLFFVAVAFYVFNLVLSLALFSARLDQWVLNPQSLSHLGGTAVMGGLWVLCARVRMSARTLAVVELVSFVAVCTAWALLLHPESNGDDILVALITTVMLRAIIVPSSARRTLGLTALASVPPLVIQAVIGIPVMPGVPHDLMVLSRTINMTSWLIAGVAISTVASRVIYGLREQVAATRDIGQYTLERKLGAGGMGEVWLARHRLLIREAAIKIIRPAALGSGPGASELLLKRFGREARATAALRSPHTVQLYDFGIATDGTLYYVMELLDGMDLETMITKYGPIPADRARDLLCQACQSLAEAHGRGLIHRDIKPANLFVSHAGLEGDFVKVLDFGLVKLGTAREASVRLTDAGTTTGTPAYMAPEVVSDREIDHRADLYSLGCVGYFLLTGKLVFESESANRVMLDHVQTKPARPSSRTEMPIPAALDDVIMSLLEKNPAKRPQNATELCRLLEACRESPGWTAERAGLWWETHMPGREDERPLADVLLSHEARPSHEPRPRVLHVGDRRTQ